MPLKKTGPSWSDVKKRLLTLDHAEILTLMHDMYTANKDNQTFLYTRFSLGADALSPYKKTIQRWLWPDVMKNQDTSVANAKKAIVDYKKAIGQPESLAELMVYYCECAVEFTNDIGLQDERYFNSLLGMFVNALKVVIALPRELHGPFIERLERVRMFSQNLGYGVGDEMDGFLDEHSGD